MLHSNQAFGRTQNSDLLGTMQGSLEGFRRAAVVDRSENLFVSQHLEVSRHSLIIKKRRPAIGGMYQPQLTDSLALIQHAGSHFETPLNAHNSERKAQIERLVYDAASEADQPNWDGENASAVSPTSVAAARRFLMHLPPSIELPECFVDPQGKMHLAWQKDRCRVFGISFSPQGTISYAGLYLDASFQGTQTTTPSIPNEILRYIKRVTGHVNMDALNDG